MSPVRTLARVALALFVVALAASLAQAGDAVDAGTVHFRADFRVGDKRFDKGRYQVRLVEGTDGPEIELLQDGDVAVRELAIVIDAKGTVKRARVSLTTNAKDEGRKRLAVRHGANRYLVFFEAA